MKKALLILMLLPALAMAQDDVYKSSPPAQQDKLFAWKMQDSMYRIGNMDAAKYYKGYKSAGTTTLLISALNPGIGLIPAISGTSGEPTGVDMSSYEMLKNQTYYNGFMEKAKSIRSRKVWGNYIIGSAFNVAASFTVYFVLVNQLTRGTTSSR